MATTLLSMICSKTMGNCFCKIYRFVPMEALFQNMIFRNSIFDLSKAPFAAKKLCIALGACHGGTIDSDEFYISKFTNNVSWPYLNMERLNTWTGSAMTEEKVFEIYEQINKMTHSNTTEGMALSKFTYFHYGDLLYASRFKTDIKSLIRMYEMNESGKNVLNILQDHGIKLKVPVKQSFETSDRFREIVKYCLIHQHMVAINSNYGIKSLNRTLDNLMEEYKNEVLEQLE